MDYEGIARRHIQDAEDRLKTSRQTDSPHYREYYVGAAAVHAQLAIAAATMLTAEKLAAEGK
mgnify:CR=1 FL=1